MRFCAADVLRSALQLLRYGYAFYEGKKQALDEILDAVAAFRCPLVEITGGEPLLQKNVLPLMSMLCDAGHTVLLETSGAHDISKVDPRVHRIMDLKTPGSGEVDKNLWSNIDHLTLRDEVKFVMGSREDYEWSRDKVQRYDLPSALSCRARSRRFSAGSIRAKSWNGFWQINCNVRFQLQMHKFIWSPHSAESECRRCELLRSSFRMAARISELIIATQM